jgi:hypothetical protein
LILSFGLKRCGMIFDLGDIDFSFGLWCYLFVFTTTLLLVEG